MSFPFFVEMAWKSAAIAGAALLLVLMMRSRSAADRSALLRLAVGLLLALPAVALLFPALQVEMAVPAAPEAEPLLRSALPLPAVPGGEAPPLAAAAAADSGWNDPGMLVAFLYLGGLLMVASRLLAGIWTLRRWTRAASPVRCPEWLAALERVAPGRPPRLLLSHDAPSPMSWGWREPVVLIDADALRRPEDAEAILAHEAAHVRRGDWPILMLSRIAVALFWFNPLVWLLERTIVEQAEEAADSAAIARVEPSRYAQTLLNCAHHDRELPASSIASGCLGRRIRAVLDGSFAGRPSGSAWTIAAMLGCAAFAAPVAAVKLVPTAASAAEPARTIAQIGPLTLSTSEAPILPGAPAAPEPPAAPPPPLPPEPSATADAPLPPAAPPAPAAAAAAAAVLAAPPAAPAPPAPPAPPLLDVETLVQLRTHGVSGDYIEALAAAGPQFRRLSPDQMIQMRIHGVSADFIRDMAASGYPALSAEQLVRMKIHGVSASAARRAAERSGERPSADELVDLAVHGKL